jgi:hypothetical protein
MNELNLDYLVDFVYQKSSLSYFFNLVKVGQPHFYIHNDNLATGYATEHHGIRASMNMMDLRRIENQYKLDSNKAFIETLIKESHKYLDNYFIEYMDKKAEIESIPFYGKSGLSTFSRFFRTNARFSFLTKHRDLKIASNLLGIINQAYKELLDNLYDLNGYIIVSQDVAQFICTLPDFVHSDFKETGFTVPIGYIERIIHVKVPNVTVFVNKILPTGTMYIGTIKRMTEMSDKLCYYVAPNSIVEYQSAPENYLDISKTYVMNLFYTIVEGKESRFKKIKLEV